MDKEENKYGKYFRDLEGDPRIQEFYKKSNFFEDRDLEIPREDKDED